jgi:NAD(P)H-flavin reductase
MQYTVRVSDKYYLTENKRFLLIKLELVKPDRIEFEAGQYVSVKINEVGERRSYSIASTPDNNHGFSLVAEMVAGGRGSEYWQNIKVGAEVELLAPLGKFMVRGIKEKLLFVATGSGIVPIWCMINDLLINKKETRPVRLHWGMRSEDDLFWVDNLERLAEEHPNFVFDIVLSKPSEGWGLCSGHVQDCLNRDFASESLIDWEGYVCGNQKMVESTATTLQALGMKQENIYHEKFV